MEDCKSRGSDVDVSRKMEYKEWRMDNGMITIVSVTIAFSTSQALWWHISGTPRNTHALINSQMDSDLEFPFPSVHSLQLQNARATGDVRILRAH